MTGLLNTKLLIAIIALLATIAASVGYVAHVQAVKQHTEMLRQQHERELLEAMKGGTEKERKKTQVDPKAEEKARKAFRLP